LEKGKVRKRKENKYKFISEYFGKMLGVTAGTLYLISKGDNCKENYKLMYFNKN